MAPLTDPDRLQAYRDAAANWVVKGYVEFELNESAYCWLRKCLDGVTTREIARLINEHVKNAGEIDEIPETRQEWSGQFQFHHDIRFVIQGVPVYVETRLNYRLPVRPDDSWIIVVNIHDP